MNDIAPASDILATQPHRSVTRDGTEFVLLGTAHVSKASAEAVRDLVAHGDYDAIASVEKLCRFQRDFGKILRNFVNFSDFYDSGKRDGVFLAGKLFLDGRAFSLTVPVSDAGKHAALAGMSSAYLAYCDCKRAGATRTIAAVLTNGDADHVFVGRNGIFYDRDGKDWDATVTKIIANPISVGHQPSDGFRKPESVPA